MSFLSLCILENTFEKISSSGIHVRIVSACQKTVTKYW